MSLTTDPARATVDIGYSQRTKIDDFALIETRLLRLGVNVTQSGSAALGLARVADGNNGTFAYTVNGVSQTKPIIRQVFRTPGTACH